jgi:beta-lactamase regulating signal transducer with metallopeptidase domain
MNALLSGANQVAAAGLAALLNTLWYAGAIVALTWLGLRFWQRVNAATRYWVWTAVLVSLLALPFVPSLVRQARAALAVRPQATAAGQPLATVPGSPVKTRELAPITLTVNAGAGSNSWPLWLLAAWMIAAGWQLTRLVRGISSVYRLKARAICSHGTSCVPWAFPFFRGKPPTRRGLAQTVVFDGLRFSEGKRQNNGSLQRAVQVLTSGEIASPVAVGFIHPAVVIPPGLLERLEEGERQDVLLHELAHLARYDDWMALATHALGALLFLHPLAAIVLGRIEREREMACDDFVVARTGSARNYARSLARLHDLRWTVASNRCCVADENSRLVHRWRVWV